GNTRTHKLRLSRVLHRDQSSKTSVSAGVQHIRSRNFFDDTLLSISSHKITEFSAGLNHGRRIWGGLLNTDLGFQKGSTAFGAQKDHHPVAGQPRAQFSKYTATLSYLRPFTLLQERFRFSSLATGQWSQDVLYGPVRFSIGGLNSVRGFRDQSLSGDSGGYWRNELSWMTPITLSGFDHVFQSFSATAAYDAGVIHGGKYNSRLHGRMTSRALAFALQGKHLSTSVTLAESLSRPDAITEKEHPVWFQISVKI
ncbi:ShlB/FhaC/HecB family hemolysin secretion/activation protein, partial [Parendozoicomonas sp. Alg238-R29]|uniref:ShlB/FhaC/HecB family hemolysin secretion/activation protein n=1 Tax=Parendozoicomonas sp. Alg238-R29 TaxID=2993446 RepID=UPI00248D8274